MKPPYAQLLNLLRAIVDAAPGELPALLAKARVVLCLQEGSISADEPPPARWLCRTFGHWAHDRTRHGIRLARSRDYRAVAVQVTEYWRECRWCHRRLLGPILLDGASIQRLSLPDHQFRALQRDGVLWQ